MTKQNQLYPISLGLDGLLPSCKIKLIKAKTLPFISDKI